MKRWFSRLILIIFFAIAALAGYLFLFVQSPLEIASFPKQITITQGSSIRTINEQLYQEGIIPDKWRFLVLAKFSGDAGKLKAGVYQIDEPLTPLQLLDKLAKGETSITAVRIIEGWTLKQAITTVLKNQDIKQNIDSEDSLREALALPADQKLEGMIFPDTYQISKGSSSEALFKQAYKKMDTVLQKEWNERDPSVQVKTSYEALILASIIEKETGATKDRAHISAVFNNRMKIGMRLQTDPTVIYGLGDSFNGNLTRKHLQTDTPYNSYTRAGLPPTPISLPGEASIHAALHPAQSKALYFVAKGDGSSIFSDTLAAHNKAVAKYQK